MNKKIRCTDLDISNMLDSNSDSDDDIMRNVRRADKKVVTRKANRLKELEFLNATRSKVNVTNGTLQLKGGTLKTTRKDLNSSEAKSKCNNLEDLLIRTLEQKRKEASMKIKLRRSTEQSNYKIDSDSDFENRKRRPLRSVSRNVLKDNSMTQTAPTIKIKVGNEGQIISYEEHNVDSSIILSSENEGIQRYSKTQVSNLRVRNSTSYNEDKLFRKVQALNEVEPGKKKKTEHDTDDTCNASDDSIILLEETYAQNNSSANHKEYDTSLKDSVSTLSKDENVQNHSRVRTLNLRIRKSINYNENDLFKQVQVLNEAKSTKKRKTSLNNENTDSDNLTSSKDKNIQDYSRTRKKNLRTRKFVDYNESNLYEEMQISDKATLTKKMKQLRTTDTSDSDVAVDKSDLQIKGSGLENLKSTSRRSRYSTNLTTKGILNNANALTLEEDTMKKNKIFTTENLDHVDEEDSSDSSIFNSITKTANKTALIKTSVGITETPRRKSRISSNESTNKNKYAEISFDNTDTNLSIETNVKQKLTKDCSVIINDTDILSPNEEQIMTKGKSQRVSTLKKKMKTYKSRTSATSKINYLTPSMRERNVLIVKPNTPLHETRARLHVSAVPKSLPCREEEFNNIYTFLKGKLLDNSGGCMYISGVPGTGKTATVNEVIQCLRKLVTKKDLANFEYVEINGMKLTEPRQAYVQILKQLTNKTATWEQALRLLEKRFTEITSKKRMTLLLVDELDLLCNKRQDVVYNILDWPTKLSARLIVLTIANTMDLPERVMMGRVTSRLGLTRLTFQPYNHKQLQEIVISRLKDSDAFRSEAVQLVARKIAAVSGDARRALDICRRATEIAELQNEEIVSIENVNQALTEMIASVKVEAIRRCSKMEQIFLQAVCAEVTRTGVEETSFKNIYKQLEDLCSFDGLKIPTVTEALMICGRLGANRLLICEHSRTDIYQRILLNVSSDDIHFSMQNIDI